jgi:16S rRNA (uracil1498-N3)-methyltransferase
MHRFFEIGTILPAGGKLWLGPENVLHAAALRLRRGELIAVCDGNRQDHICVVLEADRKSVLAEVSRIEENGCEPPVRLVLFQALAKSDKMDFIIQKAVELGVSEVVPIITEFTVSRPDDGGARAKLMRYRKISEAAAKQSGRGIVPSIGEICALDELEARCRETDMVIFAYENEKTTSLKDIIHCFSGETLGLIAGSEGGFSSLEAARISAFARPASLGKRILRTETAALYALSCINYELF